MNLIPLKPYGLKTVTLNHGLKLDRSQFLLVNKGNIINRILFKE